MTIPLYDNTCVYDNTFLPTYLHIYINRRTTGQLSSEVLLSAQQSATKRSSRVNDPYESYQRQRCAGRRGGVSGGVPGRSHENSPRSAGGGGVAGTSIKPLAYSSLVSPSYQMYPRLASLVSLSYQLYPPTQ